MTSPARRRIRFLDLVALHGEIQGEMGPALDRVIGSGSYLLGRETEDFELAFAAYVGARFCVTVGSGLDALKLSLIAAGIGPGDEVIVPAFTFIATWLAVSQIGAIPVPIDPNPETGTVAADAVDAAVTSRTAAVIPVHLYGQPCAMGEMYLLADKRRLLVVEDAAQAHGAMYAERRIGGFGHTAAWSFYPGKNLGALGDGGAVTTDDPGLAERVRSLRNYGSVTKYVHREAQGVNSRLDELQCALLGVKLGHLDSWNASRERLAKRYTKALAGSEVLTMGAVPGAQSSWHLFVVRSENRDALRHHLDEHGVDTLIHYPVAPHLQEAYAHLSLRRGSFPVTERLQDRVLSLPMGPHLTEDDVDGVVESIRGFRGTARK